MKHTLYLNPSSDKIVVALSERKQILEHKNLETTLPILINQRYHEYGFEEVVIINGPGGFTNLRIACLTLNMLQALIGNKLRFFDMTKIQCYTHAYQSGVLPRYIRMHIGQKSNQRRYDLQEKTFEMIKKSEEKNVPYADDEIFEYEDSNQLHLIWKEEKLFCSHVGKECELNYREWVVSSDHLEPHYMIQPTITLKSLEKNP